MSKQNIIKVIIGLLFAIAVALGLIQSGMNPFSGRTTLYKMPTTNSSLAGYFQRGQEIAQENVPQQTTATFLAAGDIMLSRNVADAIKKSGDVDLPFKNMADILKSTDFNFANLESPIVAKGIVGGHTMVFGAPEDYVADLKTYNFKILNLANNHAFDQGLKGLDNTRAVLDGMDIKHIGTGDNLDKAWQPAEIDANGLKICFVGASFSSINDGGKTKNDYVARIEDISELKSIILNLKSACGFIVATMHAGTEYTRTPNQAQINFAHAAIDGGADMVIGAHPHWVQTVEKYQNKYIFYSLGNFIFDQEWSQETKEGLTLKITVSKAPTSALQGSQTSAQIDSIQLLPVILENFSTPRPANEQETKNILKKIGQTDTVLK